MNSPVVLRDPILTLMSLDEFDQQFSEEIYRTYYEDFDFENGDVLFEPDAVDPIISIVETAAPYVETAPELALPIIIGTGLAFGTYKLSKWLASAPHKRTPSPNDKNPEPSLRQARINHPLGAGVALENLPWLLGPDHSRPRRQRR